MHLALPEKECCGTDPISTRNGLPSHGRRALHSLWLDHQYHRRHRRQHPLPLKYGYSFQASGHLLLKSRLLPELPDRFLLNKHSFLQCLPAFPVLQMPHSYHWNSKSPYCFSQTCQSLYCGSHCLLLPFFCGAFRLQQLLLQRQLLLLIQLPHVKRSCSSLNLPFSFFSYTLNIDIFIITSIFVKYCFNI